MNIVASTAGRAYKHLRPSLETIPDEIINQIAENLRLDIIDDDSYAECYLSDHCTDFAYYRFDLSSFSKVCTSVRWPAERALYRDIHVHFDGWDGMDNSAHSDDRGGNLRLLLRTLDGRIDLRRQVMSVQMDWDDETHGSEEEDCEDALRRFLSHCSSVRRLNLMTFPSHIFSEITPSSRVTTFATSVWSLDNFHTVVRAFPVLQDLYLVIRCPIDQLATYAVNHQLKKLEIESTWVPSMSWALEVCADITEELRVTSSGYFCRPPEIPPVKPFSPSAGINLRSLWLSGEGLNFLAYPNSSLAQAIGQLPSLQHLHVSRCLSFHAAAFSVLPSSLRCLYLFQYGEWSEDRRSRHVFVEAFSRCLAQALREIEMVAVHGLTKQGFASQDLGDLTPLQNVCDDRSIRFHLGINSNDDGSHSELRILFADSAGRR